MNYFGIMTRIIAIHPFDPALFKQRRLTRGLVFNWPTREPTTERSYAISIGY